MSKKLKNQNERLEKLLKLCDKNKVTEITDKNDLSRGYTKIYTQKDGEEYNKLLHELFKGNNKNDVPFTREEIKKEPTLDNFKFEGKNEFIYNCKLKASKMIIKTNESQDLFDKVPEKITPIFEENIDSKSQKNTFSKHLGVSYIITCPMERKEHIIKIGQSRTTFEKRLQSYNCGTVFNWRTASTTNIKILQSFVSTGLEFKLYIWKSKNQESMVFYGEQSSVFASSEILAVEEIMLRMFKKQFGEFPLANIQAKPTKV